MSIRLIQAKTGLISVKSMSKLRELLKFSTKLVLNQLKLDNCVIQGVVGKDQRLNWVKLARVCQRSIWQMIRNIKETFPPKIGMRKATSCKIQGMSRQSICMLHAAWYEPRSHVDTVDTGFNLQHIF